MGIDIMFTEQDIVEMGTNLYRKRGFTQETIKLWLKALIDNGYTEVDFEKMYDLIVSEKGATL